MADSTLKVNIVAVDKASKTLGNIGGKMKGLTGAAAAAGGAAAVAFAGTSVKAYADAESAQAKLTDAYAKFPQLAGGNIDSLRDLNSELAKKTRFDDDAYAASQATLAQFGLTEDQIKTLTPLMADYAAKTGKDLPSAAQDLGKAMIGKGGKAMAAIGVQFKDAGSLAGNFEQVMGGLGDKVGGFANKDAQTAIGQTEILKNQFGEVQESVGKALMPAFKKLSEVMIPLFTFIGDNMDWLLPLAGVFAGVAGAVWLIHNAIKAWTVVQAILNIVMSANPIGIIVIAIAGLVTALVIAYKKSETFRNIVDGALRAVGRVFGWLKNTVVSAFRWIKEQGWDLFVAIIKNSPIGTYLRVVWAAFKWVRDKIGGAVKWVIEKWNGVTNFFKTFGATLSRFTGGIIDALVWPFKFAFNLISKAWNATVGGLSFSIPDWVKFSGNPIAMALAGKSFSIPNAPEVAMAVGGKVNADGLAMLHKGEVVMPYERAMGIEGGGASLTVNLYGIATDEASVQRGLVRALDLAAARGIRPKVA